MRRTNAVVERTVAVTFAFGALAGLYPRFGAGGFVTGFVAVALGIVGTFVARTALERRAGASTAALAAGAIGGAVSAVLPALFHAAQEPGALTGAAFVLRFLGACLLGCPIGVIVGVLYAVTALPLLAFSHEVRDGSQLGHLRALEACGAALVGLPALALALSWLEHLRLGDGFEAEVLVGAALLGFVGLGIAARARHRRLRLVAWVADVRAGHVPRLHVRPADAADDLTGLPVLDGDGAVIVRSDEAYRSRSELHARVRRS